VHQASSTQVPAADRVFRWTGRCLYFAALTGLIMFGVYILLRVSGATSDNFSQWHDLISGQTLQTTADWFANVGIGMHFFMGSVLVLAWPILLSSRIRQRYRAVHRWTGRVYVTAGFLAGTGGLSFILARHTGGADHIAFAIWGMVMMVSAVMAYVHARARRIEQHRAWAIRLFAMVFGSWIYDVEIQTWINLTGGVGIGAGEEPGPFIYVMNYLFFVPNLFVAEFFIRNLHKRITLAPAWRWPALAMLAIVGLLFVYAIGAANAPSAKFGQHLWSALAN